MRASSVQFAIDLVQRFCHPTPVPASASQPDTRAATTQRFADCPDRGCLRLVSLGGRTVVRGSEFLSTHMYRARGPALSGSNAVPGPTARLAVLDGRQLLGCLV